MKFVLHVLAVVLVGVTAHPHEIVSYEGYKVIRAKPEHENHLDILKAIQLSQPMVDFWSEPRSLNSTVDLMVDLEKFEEIINIFHHLRLPHSILIENVQKAIEEAKPVPQTHQISSRSLSFDKYHRVNEINSWLDQLASKRSDIVELKTIGNSYEGRPLTVIKIGKNDGTNKPAIWIDGGIHAREWISPATALYIIDQLVNNYAANSAIVDNIDWYILPVVNPDGYEFTHTSTRLWRKTRSVNSNGCRGTDGNRNWAFHWNEGGASSNPCSDTYRGTKAFSEPETKAIADFILPIKNKFRSFLTIHSYGQYWLTPWGYTSALPSDYKDLVSLAEKATSALKGVYGTHYTIGSSTNVLYIASGGSDDWAKGVAGIKYSYTLELRDSGRYGFVLPASQIKPTGQETFEAVKVVANHIRAEG